MMLQKKSSRWAGAKALFVVPLSALALGAFARTVYVVPEDKGTKENATIRISDADNSAADDRKPLVIVDGQKVDHEALKKLDPARIASITILKDASAQEKYGEQGADGVIIVKSRPDGERSETASTTSEVKVIGYGSQRKVTGSSNGKSASGEEFGRVDTTHLAPETLQRYFKSKAWKKAKRRFAKMDDYFASDEWKQAQANFAQIGDYFSSEEWQQAQKRLSEMRIDSDSELQRLDGRTIRTTTGQPGGEQFLLSGPISVSGGMEVDFDCINARTIYLINGRRANREEVAALLSTGKVRRMKSYSGDEAVKRYGGEEARSGLLEIRARK